MIKNKVTYWCACVFVAILLPFSRRSLLVCPVVHWLGFPIANDPCYGSSMSPSSSPSSSTAGAKLTFGYIRELEMDEARDLDDKDLVNHDTSAPPSPAASSSATKTGVSGGREDPGEDPLGGDSLTKIP